ncbi:lysylphosphatidylglycerol synthase transmembrane domain-containing protein [Algoriphagus sp. CAU 1675]|uniref:lysylphosphatidylglycerol synthase transmembrane domain-containing protein n=1 Tax=Algoriphagus sp. CAU 1675 TaxID=3032597 RepID=UPI0023DA80F1|nr:lysylphosphatidylglycerol synthase transmembrane domain-containing protein [Algoriphagus sp. CAU 1675]MDF2156466.1 lysylphosphatidylglycerol synthase transmembrane domain-containing protein [Algoriphagus sp. CAU 1675]
MKLDNKKIFKTLNPNKVWFPVLIGLGIVFAMFYLDPSVNASTLKGVFDASPAFIFLAILVILFRDAGYVYRIRQITQKELTWVRAIYVIIIWEFASAVTPSVVGGTAVAIFILNKEGIKLGRAISFVMVTAILDNLFFVIGAPIILFFAKGNIFPESKVLESQLENSMKAIFWVSYGLYAAYSLIMALALFYRPRVFKWVLIKLFSIKWLQKWKHDAQEYGNQIIDASKELTGKSWNYWTSIILATIFIWSSRYLMLNALISAYVPLSFDNQIIVFARQVIMWIVMMISPTPGSSGTAEFFFGQFFTQFLGSYTFVTSIFWRLLSYYPYLIIGAIFLPRWISQVFFKKKKKIED